MFELNVTACCVLRVPVHDLTDPMLCTGACELHQVSCTQSLMCFEESSFRHRIHCIAGHHLSANCRAAYPYVLQMAATFCKPCSKISSEAGSARLFHGAFFLGLFFCFSSDCSFASKAPAAGTQEACCEVLCSFDSFLLTTELPL